MPVVLAEGGYRNISEVYMRKEPTTAFERELMGCDEHYVLYDDNGAKVVCAYDRSALFFWAHEREIKIIRVQ